MKNILQALEKELKSQKKSKKFLLYEYKILNKENKKLLKENEILRKDLKELSELWQKENQKD